MKPMLRSFLKHGETRLSHQCSQIAPAIRSLTRYNPIDLISSFVRSQPWQRPGLDVHRVSADLSRVSADDVAEGLIVSRSEFIVNVKPAGPAACKCVSTQRLAPWKAQSSLHAWGEDLLTSDILVGAACKVKKKNSQSSWTTDGSVSTCTINNLQLRNDLSLQQCSSSNIFNPRSRRESSTEKADLWAHSATTSGFTIPRSGSSSCAGKRKEKRWLSKSDQDVLNQRWKQSLKQSQQEGWDSAAGEK